MKDPQCERVATPDTPQHKASTTHSEAEGWLVRARLVLDLPPRQHHSPPPTATSWSGFDSRETPFAWHRNGSETPTPSQGYDDSSARPPLLHFSPLVICQRLKTL